MFSTMDREGWWRFRRGEMERMHLSICAWRQIDKFGRPDDCRAFLVATGFKFVAMQI